MVEESKNVILLEKMGTYHGLYHVLDGLISPLDGVNPEDINLNTLLTRIKEGNVKEIIIAVRPSVEGETTALYISKLLSGMNVKVTKIAHGIPLGADMDYIDSLTLDRSIQDRKEVL
ncbi:Recombination protein RecR [compost metagenome]